MYNVHLKYSFPSASEFFADQKLLLGHKNSTTKGMLLKEPSFFKKKTLQLHGLNP